MLEKHTAAKKTIFEARWTFFGSLRWNRYRAISPMQRENTNETPLMTAETKSSIQLGPKQTRSDVMS